MTSTRQVIPRDPVTGDWEPRDERERQILMAQLYPEEEEWLPENDPRTGWVWQDRWDWIIGALLVALILFGFAVGMAKAHDFWINHSGYKSPIDGVHCCGNNDCFEYPAEEVTATPTGWLVKPLGETVPYGETQASEDGKFWRCRKWDGTRRCFFAPQPSS
jgi:hypothetical protein